MTDIRNADNGSLLVRIRACNKLLAAENSDPAAKIDAAMTKLACGDELYRRQTGGTK